jgi:hypothetical protein
MMDDLLIGDSGTKVYKKERKLLAEKINEVESLTKLEETRKHDKHRKTEEMNKMKDHREKEKHI